MFCAGSNSVAWLAHSYKNHLLPVNRPDETQNNSFFVYNKFSFFIKLFLFPGSALRPKNFTLCTIFGRMPGIEPELLRPQTGVLPMSFTHP